MDKARSGFVGQGYIGKNYADDFEARGHEVVRYSLEPEYAGNRERIRDCGIVFVAVPTPTTPRGFDDSIVREAVNLASAGATVVIKSTIVPGTAASIRDQYPDRLVMYSPEFLSEATAAYDAAHPIMNVVGITRDTPEDKEAAERILALLPEAPYASVCTSTEAELIKYTHNGSGYAQIVFFNLMYDLAESLGASWDAIAPALKADPFIANRYSNPVHKTGRGAGGHCFIKDFAALRETYENVVRDAAGTEAMKAFEAKNKELLAASGKDIDLVRGVYGDATPHHNPDGR